MSVPVNISVIIPTLATMERQPSLLRAIESTVSQADVRATPIVVANGGQVHRDVIGPLRLRSDIRLHCTEEASFPRALQQGRRLVDTEYFSELDDDDELLPGALSLRLQSLQRVPTADMVISRGLWQADGCRIVTVSDFDDARRDPLTALLNRNWFFPGSALFRSDTIGYDYFEDLPVYLEWTYLGAKISLQKTIEFIDDVTFLYNADNPHSITKTRGYRLGQPFALRRLLELDLPPSARKRVKEKVAAAFHVCSEIARSDGNFALAWKYHIQSIAAFSSLRYVYFTRKLIPYLGHY